jgi:16S rRNA (cytidine1402-2'-O)-methyltransferase
MVALVSDAGTPTISDPGQGLIHAAIAAGIRIEPIPGPSAGIATLAVSGFATDAFAFLGFPPTRSRDLTAWLERLRTIGMVTAFYEAPHRIRGTLERMLSVLGDRPIVVGRELTKVHEEILRGPISGVLAVLTQPKGEFTVIVDIGLTTESWEFEPPPDSLILSEFGEMTNIGGCTRREVVARLAIKHRMTPNGVYEAVERAKKSGE